MEVQSVAQKELVSVDEYTLAPGKSMNYAIESNVMILPVVGTLVAKHNKAEVEIACGEILFLNDESPLELYNFYDDALINYMMLTFAIEDGFDTLKYSFDLDKHKNEMLNVMDKGSLLVSLGKFDMRKEAAYALSDNNSHSFCMVIQGSFEIEGRLLHQRDALAVWDTNALGIESLGKESILLLVEHN